LHSTLVGSASSADAGGMYPPSYSGSYGSRGSDVSMNYIQFYYFLFGIPDFI
jgi:hypothetical protein